MLKSIEKKYPPLGQVNNQDSKSSRIKYMSQDIIDLGYVLLLGVSVYLICRYLIFPLISKLAKKTKTILDDVLLDKKFLNRVSLVIVFSSLKSYVDAVNDIPFIDRAFSEILINSFLAIFIGLSISELLTIINKISTHYDSLKNKPIKGYIQIVKIIVNAFIVIIIFAIATGQPVGYYISGLGAITAILLLVFQDTILSFVASVQIGQNDIINLNDWIEVPEYGADGDVIDISLHTVKVQNWDKTITTIPTSKIVTSSVKNWRGMSDYGGRRIISDKTKKRMEPFQKLVKRYGGSAAFVAAATPIPDDLVYIPLGLAKYNPKRFFVATLLGKLVLFYVIVLISHYMGLSLLEPILQDIEDPLPVYVGIIALAIAMSAVVILMLRLDWGKILRKVAPWTLDDDDQK